MTIGAESIFVFAGFIILVGFIGEQIFRKTNVPSFLFLILIGVVIGPVLRLITRNVLTPILGTVAEFTLIMVLFYGGMEINFKALLDSSGRAIAQVFFYVSIAISLITIFVNVFLGWSLIQSLIFGAIVGGETTTIVVFKLADYIGIKEKTAVFLKLEAALNSIVLVVLFVTFVGLYQTGSANIYSAMLGLSSNFSIGVVVGLILSTIAPNSRLDSEMLNTMPKNTKKKVLNKKVISPWSVCSCFSRFLRFVLLFNREAMNLLLPTTTPNINAASMPLPLTI